jgi:hypothetical protein
VDRLNGALVGPEHPPLGQAGHAVYSWQVLVRLVA